MPNVGRDVQIRELSIILEWVEQDASLVRCARNHLLIVSIWTALCLPSRELSVNLPSPVRDYIARF